jgi:hypothetical protein
MDESQSDLANMTAQEAAAWLRDVGGELYRTPPKHGGGKAWVAVVRSPDVSGRRGPLIVALGENMQEATAAAAQQWREVWRQISAIH